MNILVIYHANCMDGFGAAFAINHFRTLAFGECAIKFIAANYNEPPPDVSNKTVFIVDFSYPRNVLEVMAEQARSVLVIDHHKTAAEDLKGLPEAPQHVKDYTYPKLSVLFDMERSGAGLTWDFFSNGQPRLQIINHVEDRDLWKFAIPYTREVYACLANHPCTTTVEGFRQWMAFNYDLESARAEGEIILRAYSNYLDKLKEGAYRVTLCSYDVPFVNAPYMFASDLGSMLSKDEPFAVVYSDSDGVRWFSLRSQPNGVDVSSIAKQFGGGGHARAAGFKTPIPLPVMKPNQQ